MNNFMETPKRQPYKFGFKIFVWMLMLSVGIYLFAQSQEIISTVLSALIIALALVHGVELQHQALHSLGFKNKNLNYIFGVILGIPMMVSFSAYQESHLAHHRALGTPQDKEFFDYGDGRQINFSSLIKLMLMWGHHWTALARMFSAVFRWRITSRLPHRAQMMRMEYLLILTLLSAGIAWSILHQSFLMLEIWLLPYLFLACPIHALLELPEHYQCNKNTRDILENTRSIKSGFLMTWFTNGNNYHVEHHMRPSWPIENLKTLHQELSSSIKFSEPSYGVFYFRVLKECFQRPKNV
jgi:fatty acid desaturase